MSLTLDIPTELETELREVAARQGRELGDYILDAALQHARQNPFVDEAARQAKADAALDELTRITEELKLYEHQR